MTQGASLAEGDGKPTADIPDRGGPGLLGGISREFDLPRIERAIREVLEIFAPVIKRPARGSYTGYGKRLPSDRPPVLSPKELALAAADGGGGSGLTLPANGQAHGFGPGAGSPGAAIGAGDVDEHDYGVGEHHYGVDEHDHGEPSGNG